MFIDMVGNFAMGAGMALGPPRPLLFTGENLLALASAKRSGLSSGLASGLLQLASERGVVRARPIVLRAKPVNPFSEPIHLRPQLPDDRLTPLVH